jgi:hypothetical protein
MRERLDAERIVRAALDLFAAIEPQLYRYPAVDPASFRRAEEILVA